MKFSEKLIILRKDMALSREDLAEILNVTKETIWDWEKEKSKPNDEQMLELSKLFRRSTEELLNNKELKEKKAPKYQRPKSTPLEIIFTIIWVIVCIIISYKVLS